MKKKMNDSGKSKLVLTILTAVCVVLIILSFTTDASIRATSLCHRSDHADPEWNERNRHHGSRTRENTCSIQQICEVKMPDCRKKWTS